MSQLDREWFTRSGVHALVYFTLFFVLNVSATFGQEPLDVRMAFLSQEQDIPLPLSLLAPEIDDYGLPGARQANKENQTTGTFTKQNFELVEAVVSQEESLKSAFNELVGQGIQLFVTDLPAQGLLEIADTEAAQDALIFNTRAIDDTLRNEQCRSNVLHIAPSRAMLADALTQYLVWKRWNKWSLVVGQTPDDKAFAEAIKRSAKRFGAKIEGEIQWTFDAGARRTDSGHVTAQQEVPAATQVDDYDVMIVADEADQFGEYLPYRTYRARPVAGTQGLIPTSWHRSHEQWGGTQLQRRFAKTAKRDMTPRDYAAWSAVRSIGEATTQIKSADPNAIKEYLLSKDFKLAAFKGVPLTFRDWNGQMRQPILIAAARMLVTVSPQKEFLHEFSPLDTLGYDRPESGCTAFQ